MLDLVVVLTHIVSDGPTVLEGLQVRDLMLLASCCKELHHALLNEHQRLWGRAIQAALPRVQMTPEFFRGLSSSGHGGAVALLPNFLKARLLASKLDVWGDSPVLRLARWRDAQLLSNRLQTFHGLSARHIDAGGTYAKVFLAQLAANKDPGAMIHQSFVPIVIPAAEALQRPRPSRKNKGRRRSVKPESRALHLHFALSRYNQLMMAVCAGNTTPPRIPWHPARARPVEQDQQRQQLVLDVSFADLSHQLLHFRGITMQVNGPWVDGPGLAGSKSCGKDMFAPEVGEEVSTGPLCIIYMRDDPTNGAARQACASGSSSLQSPLNTVMPTAATKLPDALHLDCGRGSPMVHHLTNIRFPWLAQ